jgi:DNA polymerase I-like protein with 3'-5' exonuclease and polymerase domains
MTYDNGDLEYLYVYPNYPITMEQAVELQVPLVVDVSTGNNWLEAHG